MKTLFYLLMISTVSSIGTAQTGTRYQTYTAVMKIAATKDGQQYEWENKNITVVLNYQTGEFTSRIKNHDFYDPTKPQNFNSDSIQDQIEYTLNGVFPIREIINQQTISQNYQVELHLNNEESMSHHTLLFNMAVMRPGSGGSGNYRVFTLEGTLYNDETNLPAFKGFDNEITIRLSFNGYAVTN